MVNKSTVGKRECMKQGVKETRQDGHVADENVALET